MKSLTSQINTANSGGFVLLFTLVVTAIIFFVGAGIFGLAFKELLVSTIAQESQKSIYAADSGVECALFADKMNPVIFVGQTPGQINCLDQIITTTYNLGTHTFGVEFENGSCSQVRVSVDSSLGQTTVFAQGYNKCNGPDPIRDYPGLVERVYKVTY